MNKILMFLSSALVMMVLPACSQYDYHSVTSRVYGEKGLIHKNPPAYQLEHEIDGLKLPADLSNEAIQPLYAVPPISPVKRVKKSEHQDLLLPPASLSEKSVLQQESASAENLGLGRANFYYTHQDGRIILVLDKSIDAAWQWLGVHLSTAGLTIIARSAQDHTYQVRNMASFSGTAGMYRVNLETLGKTAKTQIWLSEDFSHSNVHLDSAFYFDQLLKQLEEKK
jgi:uncharacterized lipoprotein